MFYRRCNELLADVNYTQDDVMQMYHRINGGTDAPGEAQQFQRIFNYLYATLKCEEPLNCELILVDKSPEELSYHYVNYSFYDGYQF